MCPVGFGAGSQWVKVLEQEKKAKRRRVSDLGKFATITEVSTMYTYNNQIVFIWRLGRKKNKNTRVRSYWVGWKGERETSRGVATTRIAIRPPGVCSGAATDQHHTVSSSCVMCVNETKSRVSRSHPLTLFYFILLLYLNRWGTAAVALDAGFWCVPLDAQQLSLLFTPFFVWAHRSSSRSKCHQLGVGIGLYDALLSSCKHQVTTNMSSRKFFFFRFSY